MDCTVCRALEYGFIGTWFQTAPAAFAVVEALHVVGLVLVFGTIAIVDLRLLAIPSTKWPLSSLSDDLLRWTWSGFALSLVTGVLMFISSATIYFENTFFRLKLLALVFAAINMIIFQKFVAGSMAAWDKDAIPPGRARLAGALSLLFWTCVIVFARLIGFTKTVAVESIDFNSIGGKFL